MTDFGMSKLAGATPSMTPLTMCPGTVAYMPPEALRDPPVYTKKLDCFSEGVIMIQVCTRLWPEPGPRTKLVPFPASPTGVIEMPIPEHERRKNHIDMIDCGHGLFPIAMDCLHFQENERPSSEELCQRLAGLKEIREYRESVEQVERVQNDIAELERQVREIAVHAVEQLHELHNGSEKHENQQECECELQSKDIQLKQLDGENQSLTQEMSQQLEEQEYATAYIQQTSNSLQSQAEQLQQQLSQQTQQPSQPPPAVPPQARGRQLQKDHMVKQSQPSPHAQQLPHNKPYPSTSEKLFGEWKQDRERTPHAMSRGAAVVDGNVAYFMNWDGETLSFDLSTQGWSELPLCPYQFSSLAIIRGLLTAIGGINDSGSICNKLLINHKCQKWVGYFPSMPTKRFLAAAVTTRQHLIVAGGKSKSNRLDTVEVMDTETLGWSTAASLPHLCSYASVTICGDQLYMLGGFDKNSYSKLALTCSLTKLLQSCGQTPSDSVWHRIADVPVYFSTCVAVKGELVAVGGMDIEHKTTMAIHKYNSITNSWDIISNIPTARYHCLVVVLPTYDVMIVVGGYTNIVEIASIL